MRRVDFDPVAWHCFAQESRPAYVIDVIDAIAAREPMCDLRDLSLAIAINEKIRFRVEQDRSTHSF